MQPDRNHIRIVCGRASLFWPRWPKKPVVTVFDRVFNVFQVFLQANCVSLQSCKKAKMVEALRRRVELLGLRQSLPELHGRTHVFVGCAWSNYAESMESSMSLDRSVTCLIPDAPMLCFEF